mmetsp:Transcript_35447/g.110546  ORF Transcript_35447/g.110546 Transcript_35447/m.110546 type:complete len:548 (+) Transcript_35447:198-1841(+)
MTGRIGRRLALFLVLVAAGALALQDQLAARGGVADEEGSEGGGVEGRQEVCSDEAPSPLDAVAAAVAAASGPKASSEEETSRPSWPHLLPLTHSKVPVIQNERTIAHKSVYYGRIAIGYPESQEFKVVFDTGSAHAIVASIDCQETACLKHQRYNGSMSNTAVDINIDGSWVVNKDFRDTVTVGFGTGSVYADIVREVLCVNSGSGSPPLPSEASRHRICSAMHVLVARQMSVLFETATFDGIVGLSFPKLALSHDFSFLSCLAGVMGTSAPSQFAFFLADDASGRGSELAIGGYNAARLRGPLSWVPVSEPQEGHWKVSMSAVTIGGEALDICRGDACQGIVDTGTSHLGVPREDLRELILLLSRPAEETTDCREVEGAEITIWLSGLNLTLSPREYMRPLPLRAGTYLNKDHLDEWVTVPLLDESGNVEAVLADDANDTAIDGFTCTPRLFPVVLKPGKKIFLLGEPVLQRYYSVFDWVAESIGFGLADQEPEAASNGFDDNTLLQVSVLSGEADTRVDTQFAVRSTEGLDDATSVGLALGLAGL